VIPCGKCYPVAVRWSSISHRKLIVPRGGSRKKNIWGAWPLIIWEATTSRTTVSNCPVLSNLCTIISLKIWGAWARFGGLCPPGPNLRPPLRSALSSQQFRSSMFCCRRPVDLEFAARQSLQPSTESQHVSASAEDILFAKH